jgi:hypothetical protein
MAHHVSPGHDPDELQEAPTCRRQCEDQLCTRAVQAFIEDDGDGNRKSTRTRSRGRTEGLPQHQLIIDGVLTEQEQEMTTDNWIFRVLLDYDIDRGVIHTIERLSQQWRAVLTAEGRVISDPIPIHRDIF